MKYLKLDARHPECHGLARTLVGSPVVAYEHNDRNEIWRLSAIEEAKGDLSFGIFCPDGKFFGCTFWDQTILLQIDTLKLCPFVALRENLWKGAISCPDGFDAGLIKISHCDILEDVKKGKIIGAEIVEVEK